jgi:hypothetical protein
MLLHFAIIVFCKIFIILPPFPIGLPLLYLQRPKEAPEVQPLAPEIYGVSAQHRTSGRRGEAFFFFSYPGEKCFPTWPHLVH